MPADSECGPPEPICTLRKASGIDRENTALSRRQCHHDALPWPEDSRATPVPVRISTCEVYAIWLRVFSRKSAFTLLTCHQNAPLLPTPRLPPRPGDTPHMPSGIYLGFICQAKAMSYGTDTSQRQRPPLARRPNNRPWQSNLSCGNCAKYGIGRQAAHS